MLSLYRVTCPFCLHQCALALRVRIAAGAVGIASVAVAAILVILFVNANTQLIVAHQQLGITLVAVAVMAVIAGGQALSVVICSRFGSLAKPSLL